MSGAISGFVFGMLAALLLLCAAGKTPGDMREKLCAESDWQLPSCVAYVEHAVNEAKGIKK